MGTRGTYGFRYNGQDKLSYCHYDSYPSGLGSKVLNFIKDTSKYAMQRIFNEIILVPEDGEPTKEQVERYKYLSNDKVGDVSMSGVWTWYSLLRKAHGDLSVHKPGYVGETGPIPYTTHKEPDGCGGFLTVQDGAFVGLNTLPSRPMVIEYVCPYMIDACGFIKDSLFCEYGYIINLDTEELEFWVGFQTKSQKGNRYGGKKRGTEYAPCRLAGTWLLERCAAVPGTVLAEMMVSNG